MDEKEIEKMKIESKRIYFSLTIKDLKDIEIGSENISSLTIVHDYINKRTPIYILRMFLPLSIWRRLNDLLDPFKPIIEGITLRLSKQIDPDGDMSLNNLYTFRSYSKMSATIDKVDDYDFKDNENMDSLPATSSDDNNVIITLGLFKPDDISAASNDIVNDILPSANMNQVLFHSLKSSLNKGVKIFPEPSTNNKTYENVVLPPLGLLEELEYIQDEYSIYKYPPTTYCRDGVFYVFPMAGEFSERKTLPKPYNYTYYIDIRNSLNINGDDYVKEITEDAVSIIMGKERLLRNKVNNLKHQLYAYLSNDSIAIPEKKKDILYDRIIVSSKNGDIQSLTEEIKQRVVSISLRCIPVEMDIYPITLFKIINERIEGYYRVSKYIEVFTNKDFNKTVELFGNIE